MSLSRPEIELHLASLLASDGFAHSPRMSRFLRFTVEETLAGRAAELKESVIGSQVFDRPVSYDPRLDPIVRVEARRLRAKLKAYYEGAGREAALHIEYPRGTYAPTFSLCRAPTAVPQAPESFTSIAVLPFQNLGSDAGPDYFSDGLSEELLSALTRIKNLRVVSWSSALHLREQATDANTVRQQLGASYALQGSVRRTPDRLRITAHLVETATGHYGWSATYDRQLADLFQVQEEIAQAIASSLRLHFAPPSPAPRPASLAVHELCLKGRFHGQDRTAEGLRRSLACFTEAIAVAPEYAAAHAGLADTYTLLAEYGFADAPDAFCHAKESAQRALCLDPNSAEAHASLALTLALYDWAWDDAIREFERSLELNPNYVPARFWYASDCLAVIGQLERAHVELATSLELDPLSVNMRVGQAYFYLLEHRYEEALAGYRAAAELDPSFYKAYTSMGRAYLCLGNPHEAIVWLEKGRALAGDVPSLLGALAQAHGLTGDRATARTLLAKLHSSQQGGAAPPSIALAFAHLGLGDRAAAMTLLERALDRREPNIVGLGVHPAFDELRPEPRFQALLARLGLRVPLR